MPFGLDEILASDRLGAVHLMRLVMAVLTVLAVTHFDGATGAQSRVVVTTVAVALLISTTAEIGRRLGGWPATIVGPAMLAGDGLWLAVIREATGGPMSLLGQLVVLHVVGVTLLASSRTGMKVALWHGALYAAGYVHALASGVDPHASMAAVDRTDAVVLGALSFLVLAGVTAAMSAVNERELRRGRADMAVLAALAADLDRVRRPEEIADVAVRHAAGALGFERSALVTTWQGRSMLQVGPVSRRLDTSLEVTGADEVVEKACRTGEPVLARRLGPLDSDLAAAMPNAANVVIVPLSVDGRRIGALALEHGAHRPHISRRVVDLITQFSAHIAMALQSAWLLVEIERLASVDELTGLANRRVFEETLNKEMRRSARTGRPVALAMVDIDHFKQVNDEFGHPVGDAVLATIGRLIGQSVRAMDTVARYGGEEIAVILPECDSDQAAEIADRIRRKVATADGPVPVTVSVGVAAGPRNGIDPSTLLSAADAALYESKRAGRDRVTVAGKAFARPLIAGV